MPDDSKPSPLCVTVIGGDRLANDYEAISPGPAHCQDQESDRALSKSGNGETVTGIRKNTGELKQSLSLDLFRVSLAAWTAQEQDDG